MGCQADDLGESGVARAEIRQLLARFGQPRLGCRLVGGQGRGIAGQRIANFRVRKGLRVQSEHGEGKGAQLFVAQELVDIGDQIHGRAKIGHLLPHDCIEIVDAVVVEADQRILLCAGLSHRGCRTEVEGLRKIAVAFIRETVGKTVIVLQVTFQNLAHEGLGIGHVLQAMRLHRVGVEPVVVEERVDGFHAVDVFPVMLGLARDLRLLGNTIEAAAQITRDATIVEIGRYHAWPRRLPMGRPNQPRNRILTRHDCSTGLCVAFGRPPTGRLLRPIGTRPSDPLTKQKP
ncbi:hypothetical protein D9M68_428390 [compost metagenome]